MYIEASVVVQTTTHMFNYINYLLKLVSDELLLLGDSNFRYIDWGNCIADSSLSNKSIEILRDNFLIQHVTSPTRARGCDTPHISDLVIFNDFFVTNIDYWALSK